MLTVAWGRSLRPGGAAMAALALPVTAAALFEGNQELQGTVKGKVINELFSVATATSNRSGVGMVARAATA